MFSVLGFRTVTDLRKLKLSVHETMSSLKFSKKTNTAILSRLGLFPQEPRSYSVVCVLLQELKNGRVYSVYPEDPGCS